MSSFIVINSSFVIFRKDQTSAICVTHINLLSFPNFIYFLFIFYVFSFVTFFLYTNDNFFSLSLSFFTTKSASFYFPLSIYQLITEPNMRCDSRGNKQTRKRINQYRKFSFFPPVLLIDQNDMLFKANVIASGCSFESIHLLYIDLYLVLPTVVTCRPYISFHTFQIQPRKRKTVVILIDEVVFVKMSFFILESLSDASARVYILLKE